MADNCSRVCFLMVCLVIAQVHSRTLHGIKLKKDPGDDLLRMEAPEWTPYAETELLKEGSSDAPEKLTISLKDRKSAESGAEREIEPDRLFVDDDNYFSVRVKVGTDTESSDIIKAEMVYFGEDPNTREEKVITDNVIEIEVQGGTWTFVNSRFQIPDLSDEIDWLKIKLRISGPDAGVPFEFRDVTINNKSIDPGITNLTTENVVRWGTPLAALALLILIIFYSSIKHCCSRRKTDAKKSENTPDIEGTIPSMKKDEPLVPHTNPQKRLPHSPNGNYLQPLVGYQ